MDILAPCKDNVKKIHLSTNFLFVWLYWHADIHFIVDILEPKLGDSWNIIQKVFYLDEGLTLEGPNLNFDGNYFLVVHHITVKTRIKVHEVEGASNDKVLHNLKLCLYKRGHLFYLWLFAIDRPELINFPSHTQQSTFWLFIMLWSFKDNSQKHHIHCSINDAKFKSINIIAS